MDARATGIVLRTRPLTETSLIVQWLTPQFGRLSTVAKGARRAKSPFLGKLDLFFEADFTFHQSRRSDLHTLREIRVLDYHGALREELGYLQQASYFTQLLEMTTEVNTPLPEPFELLAQALRELPQTTPHAGLVYAFEMRLLAELGLSPDLSQSGLTAGAREILRQLHLAPWTALGRLTLSSAQQEEIGRFLGEFLVYHFGRVAKARASACSLRR